MAHSELTNLSQVSDSELEWLENDLEEIIEEEGPDAKERSKIFQLLLKSIIIL